MKKLKTQRGITLIALIITIVVLLILAVVAIGAAQDSNIVGYAQNAASEYETGKGKENNAISDMEALLNKYSTGGNSAENNNGFNSDGTNDNPSGGNNGGTDEPEITPPEVEEPDPTPPAPVYYSKTLNDNMNNYAEVLALSGSELYNLLINRGTKITYISGANRLEVSLKSGTSFQQFALIYVTYINEQGETSRYAINSNNTLNLDNFKTSPPYNYIPAGEWTKPSGETFSNDFGETADIYEPISQIPVFEGEWQIDEANSTPEGKIYLENVLEDVTN